MKPVTVFVYLSAAFLILIALLPRADAATVVSQLEQKLQQKLAQKQGSKGPKIQGLRKTPYFGLYEFRFGRTLGYTDEKVSYILFGSVTDGNTLEDLSQARLEELSRIRFDDLPLNLAIKTVKGDGSRKIAVFADPNCGYCKKFEKELEKADNLTIYVFVYPILGPDSVEKSRNILCASDRSGTWSGWMLNEKALGDQVNCSAPLTKLMDLGKRLEVEATPTIYLADGRRISGALSLDELEKELRNVNKKQ